MAVKISDIKQKGINGSSNPLDEWVNSKKQAVQEETPSEEDGKPVTKSNPFDVYLKKKSGIGESTTTLPKDTAVTSTPVDNADPLSGWHRRKIGDETQVEESQKQGGVLNLKPQQQFNSKLNSGDLTGSDLDKLKKTNPEKYATLTQDIAADYDESFLKTKTASAIIAERLNKKQKEVNFIESKDYDASYYKNLDLVINENAEPTNNVLNSIFADTGTPYSRIIPTKDIDKSRDQLKTLTDADKLNNQQIEKDKIVNFVAPMPTTEGIVNVPQIFDVTKMSDEEIERKKAISPDFYNQLIAAKQKVAQGNQKAAVLHKSINPIQTQFGSNLLRQQKETRLPDPNKDGNDYVREIGEQIFKEKDPETYALYQQAGGYNKNEPYRNQVFNSKLDGVNKEIMTLGYNALRGDVAANGTDSQYANIYDNLKYLDYKFSTPKEQETKHRVAAALKEKGINPSKATEAEKDEVVRTLPEDNQQVWFNKTKETGHTDLPNTGFLYSAGNSFVRSGTNILQSGSVLSPTSWATLFLGVPSNKEMAQEILGERMESSVIGENPESKQRYDELKLRQADNTITPQEQNELNDLASFTDKRTSWDKFKDGNGNMVGMIAAITTDAIPTLGGGAMSNAAVRGTEALAAENLAAKGVSEIPLLSNANAEKTLIQKLGIPTDTKSIINLAKNKNEMFVLMHHDNAKKAMELFPEDDTKKAWYTGITDVISVALPNLLPTHKLGQLFNAETKTVVADLVSKISEKNLDKAVIDNLMQSTAKKIIEKSGTFLVGAEKTAAEAALTMSLMTLGNNVTQAILKPDSISGGDIADNFTETFSSTFMDSQLVGLIGGYGAVQKKYGQVGVDAIYDATNSNNSVNSVKYTILEQQSKGELTQEQANSKISILQTAAELREPVNNLQVEENLSPASAKRVFINLLNERVQKNKIKQLKDAGASEALIIPLENRVKEINDITTRIIGKEIHVNEDYSIIDMKEKEAQDKAAEDKKNDPLAKVKDIINKDEIQGFSAQPLKDAVEANDNVKLNKYLENIAEQAHDEKSLPETVKTYGQELVDIAKEMFPKKPAENIKEVLTPEQINTTQPILDRVNNAEYINEKEIKQAEDVLYEALNKNPDAAHLIEPLISKIQDYEFTTKTETGTLTKEVSTETVRPTRNRATVSKNLDQWQGSRATTTDAIGKEVSGILRVENGKYSIYNENGEKVASLGEKAITDRDVTLPSTEDVPMPIQIDKDGNVKSLTLQLNKVDKENGGIVPEKQITIEFKDPEKALDYAIGLRAEQIGEIDPQKFDMAYEQISREVSKEVPIKDLSQKNTENENNAKGENIGEVNNTNKDIGDTSGSSSESDRINSQEPGQKTELGNDISSQSKTKSDGNSKKANGESSQKSSQESGEKGGKESNGKENADVTDEGKPESNSGSGTPSEKVVDVDEGGNKRRFTKQELAKPEILPEAKAEIQKNIEYVEQAGAMSIAEANATIDKIGVDESFNLVINRNNSLNGGVRGVMGQVLILKYNDLAAKLPEGSPERNYYVDKTIDVANFVAEKLATDPGQMIQSFSLFQRLSPEGQLRAAIKDQKKQAESKKAKVKPDVDELGNKLKKINEETADEVLSSPKVKKTTEEAESDLKVKSKDRIKKAQDARTKIIEKYKGEKGKNLYAGVGLTKEGIEFVGNLVKTYIDEGIGEAGLIIDKVLQELKNVSGKEISDEVKNNINEIVNEQSEKFISKNAAAGIKELAPEIGKIIKDHYTLRDAEKKSLVDKFIERLGFDNAAAKELAKDVEAEFDKIATRKKEELLSQEKKRWDRIQEGLKGSKKDNDLQSQMIKYSNLRAFSNEGLLNMLSDKLGVGQITPEQGAKITELAKKIQEAPEGSPKKNATEKLLTYRANLKGTSWGEVAQGVWYANVLSGYATHIRNVVSTFANTVSYFSVEAARNPKSIPYLWLGLKTGISRIGVVEAAHTIKTGQTPIHISKIETPDVLERTTFKGGLLNPANYLKYVGRLMKAEDVLLFQGLKEMRATQLALREANRLGYKQSWNPFASVNKNVTKKVNELLLNTNERYQQSLAQIKEETPELKEGQREHTRRVYELMELSRPIQMTEDAYGFAAKGTFNHEVEGTLGALNNGVAKMLDIQMGGVKPLRFVVPFTRILTNVANNTIDFSPLGFVRAARNKRGFESFEGSPITKEAYHVMTPEERRQTIAKASLGTAAMATLYTMSGMGLVQVSGAGPSDIKKKLQLMEAGWQPYSIKIGEKYYSYKLTPFVFAFGLVGSIRDHETYDKDIDDQSLAQRTSIAAWDGIKNIGDMTWVSSAAPLMSAMATNNSDEATRILSSTGSKTAKSFIVPNLYTQIAQKYEQIFNIPQKKVNGFFQSLVQDVPIARNYLNDKINALGDPVVRDVDVLSSKENPDPVWQYLTDKKAWVAPVNKNTIIIFDEDKKQDRPVSEDEYYEFSKLRGGMIKKELNNILQFGATIKTAGQQVIKTADELTTAELQKILSSISTEATKDAKAKLFEPKSKKQKVKITVNQSKN